MIGYLVHIASYLPINQGRVAILMLVTEES